MSATIPAQDVDHRIAADGSKHQAERQCLRIDAIGRTRHCASIDEIGGACMGADDGRDVSGKVKGGIARAASMTPAKRTEVAKKAAQARWGVKATHKGNFKEQLGIDVECYVLDDVEKTAVISQTGMARALGLSSRGNAFPRFLSSKAMLEAVGAETRQKIENPIKFQWGTGGADDPPATVNGYDATILIDVCRAVISADLVKRFGSRYDEITKQAHLVVGASAKSGIKGLVYAIAGYNPSAEEVISAFKVYVQDEARKYEPEFPQELYVQWHRLYEIPVPVRGKPWHFKFLTVNHVYHPLAKSSGNIYALLKALKAADGDRQKKLFQFLNAVGARALRMHLGRILEMAESSPSRTAYENRIAERFGGQTELDLVSVQAERPSAEAPE